MKTLTLKEAYALATPGPLVFNQGYLEAEHGKDLFIVAEVVRVPGGEPSQAHPNAALLAHAFNVLPQVTERLSDAIDEVEKLAIAAGIYSEYGDYIDRNRAFLAKINTVQIP